MSAGKSTEDRGPKGPLTGGVEALFAYVNPTANNGIVLVDDAVVATRYAYGKAREVHGTESRLEAKPSGPQSTEIYSLLCWRVPWCVR